MPDYFSRRNTLPMNTTVMDVDFCVQFIYYAVSYQPPGDRTERWKV
jgi:hypothetical protein